MGFKMKGSPAKLGTISGTAGHRSALKMKAEADAASALKLKQASALKQEEERETSWWRGEEGWIPDEFQPNVKRPKVKTEHGKQVEAERVETEKVETEKKKSKDANWKKGMEKSGGKLNELVKARKGLDKGSPEYAAIQNKINEALGSKKRHEVKGSPEGTKKTDIVKPGPDEKLGTDDDVKTVEDRVKGLGRKKGKTLRYADKTVEKQRIAKEREDIKKAKKSGDKVEKAQSQKEISEIKSGRDDAKTGTVVSRWWHKGRAKRKAKKEAKERAKNPPKVTVAKKDKEEQTGDPV